jgi:hypothetical protein
MKKIVICIFSVLFFVLLIVDYRQFAELTRLRKEVSSLQNKIYELSNNNDEINGFISSVSDESFDYLAIGNSITAHMACDYWHGDWGMAASSEEMDYYHLVVNELEADLSKPINSLAYNYCIWETQSYDRSETWTLLDELLTSGIDLVTVQMSENVNDFSTFKSDFQSLIRHIQEKCGQDVIIIIIDDYWDDDKSEIKRSIVEELKDPNIMFVDLSDIRGDSEYLCKLGTIIYGSDGAAYENEHEGVAAHPGDKGMKVIADRIINCVLSSV